MTGEELRKFRERRGLERAELAELLNSSLGTKYDSEAVARWERGARNPSRSVVAFLEELALEHGFGGAAGDPPDDHPGLEDDDGLEPGDTHPGPGRPEPQLSLVSGGSVYTKACTELWEMVATGIGMVGASLGNHAVMNDGAIIAADAPALGAAWGRLAETNDTFRRMLVGMTDGGVWLQVALATGTTFSKCYQSHAQHAAAVAAHLEAQAAGGYEHEPAAA